MSILDELRNAIRESGRSQQEIADAVGVNLVSLNRFIKGHRGMSVETAEKLARVLGLRLITDKPKRKRGGK